MANRELALPLELLSQAPFPEIISRHVLPRLPVPTLLALCATSSQYRQWCQDESLWAEIAQRDYPGTQRLPGESWLGLVQEMQERRLVPIYRAKDKWELVISKGMSIADLVYLLLYLPYVLSTTDKSVPLTLAVVQQLAAQLPGIPTFTTEASPAYYYSQLFLQREGIVVAAKATFEINLGMRLYLLPILRPGPAGTIQIDTGNGQVGNYPPSTVLARIFLLPFLYGIIPAGSTVGDTLYLAIGSLRVASN